MAYSYIEKRKPFTLNLSLEHAIAQRNYGRLLKLFPGWKTVDVFTFRVGAKKVCIQVQQRDAYSSVFAITEQRDDWVGVKPVQCRFRAYHDAKMIEITEWNGSRRFKARYRYPNPEMMARDEKWQLNRFIGEWFDHCIQHGEAADDIDVFQNTVNDPS